MAKIKNKESNPVLFYLKGKKKPVTIGPRGTIEISAKDLEASPQLQRMISDGILSKLTDARAKKGAAPSGKSSAAEKKSKSEKR